MAIALDQNLGSGHNNAAGPLSVSTGAAVAAGAKIFAAVSWFNSAAATMTVSGGSLTWASAKQQNNGSDRAALWVADAPAGLATATSITATAAATGQGGLLLHLISYTGLATGLVADTTNFASGTGASWSSGAATNVAAASLFFGVSGNETATSTTSTPTAGTERVDTWDLGAGQGIADGEIIAASVASRAITGTWVGAASTANTGALVVFPGTGFTAPSATPDVPAGHFTPQLNQKAWY